MATGINFHEQSLLFDAALKPFLKPASQTRVDPMHVIFSNGMYAPAWSPQSCKGHVE